MSNTVNIHLTLDDARLVLGVLNHAADEGERRTAETPEDFDPADNSVERVRHIAKLIEARWPEDPRG